ncbi:hypothetical protein KJZ71_05770 [Patescibacteria group bacterium]|nr:hypothetical protein [Patescibacteria group bacterium]
MAPFSQKLEPPQNPGRFRNHIKRIQDNDQTWERWRARGDHQLLRARAMELDPAFDLTQYAIFNQHLD